MIFNTKNAMNIKYEYTLWMFHIYYHYENVLYSEPSRHFIYSKCYRHLKEKIEFYLIKHHRISVQKA